LTAQVPFEVVDAVLADTRTESARVRDLPARVVVYLLLAGALFAEVGYRQVWDRLVAGLHGLAVASPTSGALTQARRRLGPAPLRTLFGLLAGPAAAVTAGGVRWCGLLVVAIDGTTISVPDSAANLRVFTKQAGHHGGSGYPLLRLVTLVACGTRTVIDAVFGPTQRGDHLYPAAAARVQTRHAHAGRPQLRRRGSAHRDQRHRHAAAGARQERPQAAGTAPPRRRVV
jgi:hypothetical protein